MAAANYHTFVSGLPPERYLEPHPPPAPAGDPDEHGLRGYRPVQPEGRLREVARKLWMPLAAVGLLVWKFKALALPPSS